MILKIFINLSETLSYMHKHKLLHRDIKPSNILLDKFYEPKFSDFNLSKAYDEKKSEVTGITHTSKTTETTNLSDCSVYT